MTENPWGKMPPSGRRVNQSIRLRRLRGRGSDKARIVEWHEKTGEFFVVRPAGHCFCYVNVAFLDLQKVII